MGKNQTDPRRTSSVLHDLHGTARVLQGTLGASKLRRKLVKPVMSKYPRPLSDR